MARSPTGGGALDELVALDKREPENDEYGNTVDIWQEQFQTRAAFVHLLGSEAVMAARLEGRHSMIVRLRRSDNARSVTSDWRLRDLRRGVEYAIREASEDASRAWVDLIVESGVAP